MYAVYVIGLVVAFDAIVQGSPGDAVTEATPVDTALHTENLLNDMWVKSTVARRNTPPYNQGGAVQVGYGMALIGVKFVDFSTGVVDLLIWEQMAWTDNRLSWNPDDYGGIKEVRVPSSMIWKPDLMAYNSYVSDDHKFRGEVNIVVYSTGDVLYVPPTTKQIMCDISDDAETASCEIKIGSWTYSANLVDVKFYNDKAEMSTDNFKPNSFVTAIANNTATREEKQYACCEEIYPSLLFNFDLELNNN